MNTDIPTLMDAMKNLILTAATPLSARLQKHGDSGILMARSLSRMRIAPQFLDLFGTMFGYVFDLQSTLTTNIWTLSISLANDIANVIVADAIHAYASDTSIDLIFASSDLCCVSPMYAGTEVDAFGMDPNTAKDQVIIVGALNSGLLANIATLSKPKSIGAGMNLGFTLRSIAQGLQNLSGIAATLNPDQFIAGGGIFGDGSDAMIWNNGWPQVNQSALPAVGVVIIINLNTGGIDAQNLDFIPGSGG